MPVMGEQGFVWIQFMKDFRRIAIWLRVDQGATLFVLKPYDNTNDNTYSVHRH